jgi:hypothetical protein
MLLSAGEEVSYSLFCAIRSISKKDLLLNKFASKETPLSEKIRLHVPFASIFNTDWKSDGPSSFFKNYQTEKEPQLNFFLSPSFISSVLST